ncbi:MAG: LacI family DNA-binding transcriptional regulator [Dongiaceae bacterium]
MAKQIRKATIKDVAVAAGVGWATVSRVLNDQPHVNDVIKQRVIDAINQLNYKPDLVARSMRARESKTLAFVVRDFTGPTLSALADAVQKEADDLGFSLYVASSYHDAKREIALIQSFKARRVDGIVMATSSETDKTLQHEIAGSGLPFVLLDREAPVNLDAVLVEHARGVEHAIRYLADMGHARIAMVTGEPDVYPTRDRIRGYREGLAAAGIAFGSRYCRHGSFSSDHAYEQVKSLLKLKQRPTAIIAGGTALLPGALHAIAEFGLRIPRDISLIAGADSDLARYVTPPVTVIRWDHEGFGRVAGRFLLNRLSDPRLAQQRQIFGTSLVVRGSCAPPAPSRG